MNDNQYLILAVNPGTTSTKIALYKDKTLIFKEKIEYQKAETEKYLHIADQLGLRKDTVLKIMQEKGANAEQLSAVVGRGGLLPPVCAGAYKVNQLMLDRLINRPVTEHASNLGAMIAYDIAEPCGIPAYVYDPVSVDQFEEVARITGLPSMARQTHSHVLNSRSVAMKMAKSLDKPYDQMTFIVAHIGGGISINLHCKGRMIDVLSDDEGPFSPERSGRLPTRQLIKQCFSRNYQVNDMVKLIRGKGGLVAHMGTEDVRQVEAMINNGDKHAQLIYYAMAYQVAKGIGEMATVVGGAVDRIILTGGVAYSEMFTNWVKEKVQFIAPVEIMAGENELEALAFGALRVLKGEEEACEYVES